MKEKTYMEKLDREGRRKFMLATQLLRDSLSDEESTRQRAGMTLMALQRELLPTLKALHKNPETLREAGLEPSRRTLTALNRLIADIEADLKSAH